MSSLVFFVNNMQSHMGVLSETSANRVPLMLTMSLKWLRSFNHANYMQNMAQPSKWNVPTEYSSLSNPGEFKYPPWLENYFNRCRQAFINHDILKTNAMDPFQKSYNASHKCPTMHYFLTEMCTHAHFCYKVKHCGISEWCIVGFEQQVNFVSATWDIFLGVLNV